ncbi:MAG: protein-L-isoaspartate(D-aspartate) O-methyltransferase [Alphaproteobacteria bacterium]|nr:protein-L-isoaspartate(D-aspartate) O-methyltransferase [Alphaproteobacteria bacterium]
MSADAHSPTRKAMLAQLAAYGITDARVLAAMAAVPRERFVPRELAARAYADTPLPIGEGQTISQPYIVARMAQLAAIGQKDRVLDVGTGSGYGAAVLAGLAAEVYSIERHASLLEAARRALADCGIRTVRLRCGDGSLGWPEAAPFDAIIVAAAAPHVPAALLDQLAPGGRLIAPIGPPGQERLVRSLVRKGGELEQAFFDAVAFVPLIGAEGQAPK